MKQSHTLSLYYIVILFAVFFFSVKTMAFNVSFIFINHSKDTMHVTEGKYTCMEGHTQTDNLIIPPSDLKGVKLFNYNGMFYNCNSRQNVENWYMSLYNNQGIIVCSLYLHWNLYYRFFIKAFWHVHYKLDKNYSYPMCSYKVDYTKYSKEFTIIL